MGGPSPGARTLAARLATDGRHCQGGHWQWGCVIAVLTLQSIISVVGSHLVLAPLPHGWPPMGDTAKVSTDSENIIKDV